MVIWETLKLIVTPLDTLDTIFCAIVMNILIFLATFITTSFVIILIVGDYYINETIPNDALEKKFKRLRKIQYITIGFILIFATISYVKDTRTAYYKVKVEITTNELALKELKNVKEMYKFPENLRRDKLKDVDNIFFATAPIYKDKTTGRYKPRYTKIINEDEKMIFTTRIAKRDYEEYASEKVFKHDIEDLVKYTIAYTKEENEKTADKRGMKEFTKKHTELNK